MAAKMGKALREMNIRIRKELVSIRLIGINLHEVDG